MKRLLFICFILILVSQISYQYALHLYPSDFVCVRIRQLSSKKSEQLFKDIAMGLLNGRLRFISLDTMIKILKDFRIVEFSHSENDSIKEIILKEIAFRMLKQHYLPKVDDKIKVSCVQEEFLKDTAVPSDATNLFETKINLPFDIAITKNNNRLRTIYWSSIVSQISNVIEKLWLRRLSGASLLSDKIAARKESLKAVVILRNVYLEGRKGLSVDYSTSDIANTVYKKIDSWLKEGIILEKEKSLLCEIFIQYIILASAEEKGDLLYEITGLSDINCLREKFRCKIIAVIDALRCYNSTDYGMFAMLQSLLNDISSSFPTRHDASLASPAIDLQESRHSA